MRRPGRPVGSCRRCPPFAGRAAFRARRIALGLSHVAIAAALEAAGLGVTARAVCGWEIGDYCPDEQRLPVLARLLSVRVAEVEGWFWPGSSAQSRKQVRLPLAGSPAAAGGHVESSTAKGS